MPTPTMENYIYLDWAATAPLCKQAARAMHLCMQPDKANIALGANPNSLHSPGRAAFASLEGARKNIAAALGACRANELIFTSGATEANNTALFGIAKGALLERARKGCAPARPRIITTAIEHESVTEPCLKLKSEGFDLVFLEPNSQGFITGEALEKALCESKECASGKGAQGASGKGDPTKGASANNSAAETLLVSIQAANSEVGSVQNIEELARIAHAHGALFHTDATQALGKIDMNLQAWDIDAASFSAHKIAGPKGIGALYVRARTPFEAFILGGGQETGLRSGTQNLMGVLGFEAACARACEVFKSEVARERKLRDFLYAELDKLPLVTPSVKVETQSERYLPNIVNVLVSGHESQTLIIRLDELGFGVSGGSACASNSLKASPVLRALGIPETKAQGALRISFGNLTTKDDLCAFIEALKQALRWEKLKR